MLLPAHTPVPDDAARRSQRKTKRIDRDRFAIAYYKQNHPKRHKHSLPSSDSHSQVHSYCQKLMNVSLHSHQSYLLSEMGKALREQSHKLFSLCKIKLKLGEELPPLP